MSDQNADLGRSWADEAGDDDLEQEAPAPSQPESSAPQSSGNATSSPHHQNSTQAQDENNLTLFVNNIPYESSNEALRRFFENAGCKVVRSWVSGKGSGNVAFDDLQSVQLAMTLQDQDFEGRNINLKPAYPKKNDFSRRGDQDRNRDRRNNNNNGRPESRGDNNYRRPFDNNRRNDDQNRRNDDQNRRNDDQNRRNDDQNRRYNNNDRRSDNREERGRDRAQGPSDSNGPRRDQNSRSPTTEVHSQSPVEPKERPKLQLLPRTVGETAGQTPTNTSKSNPFGAARPREVVLQERQKQQPLSNSSDSPSQTPEAGASTSSSEQPAQQVQPTPESTSAGANAPETAVPSSEQAQPSETDSEFQLQQKSKPKPKPKSKPAPQNTQQQQQKGKPNNRAGTNAPNSNPKGKPKQPAQAQGSKPGDKKKGTQNIYAFLGESSS